MRSTLLLVMLMTSCSDARLVAEEPVWGKQQCSHCAMLVSEKVSAAQLVTTDSKRRFFDDLGCMVAWELREHPTVAARWVRANGSWADPGSSHFSAGHATPMDFGFVADAAGTLTFDEVRTAVQERQNGAHP